MAKAILNYTTTISAARSVAEVQGMLAEAGATSVLVDYARGLPVAVSFAIDVRGTQLRFRLPCRHEAVHATLKNKPRIEKRFRTEEHALRVAWRIVKDWLAVQLAIIEADMVSIDEIMLPYMLSGDGTTLYQFAQANNYLMLEDKMYV